MKKKHSRMRSVDGEDPCRAAEQIAWHMLIPYEGTDSHSPMQQCVVKKS